MQDKHIFKSLPTQNNHWERIMPKGMQAFLNETGEITRFVARFFKALWLPPYEFKEVVKQCYEVGNRSLPLVGLTSFHYWTSTYTSIATHFSQIWCGSLAPGHGGY
jgi:ABC-type transporter Mla maintaining outer membrane lipid asymmetry permease subunit MlaE